jgi:hypothetical protein
MIHIVLGWLLILLLLVLIITERLRAARAREAATRDFRLAMRYIAERRVDRAPQQFAELFLSGNKRWMELYFPDFERFRQTQIAAEEENDYVGA